MERREFLKNCCYGGVAISVSSNLIYSCTPIYYATSSKSGNQLTVAKSEFIELKNGKEIVRPFVLLQIKGLGFPIYLYESQEGRYTAAFLKCTHQGCELNVGGDRYACPCHGSEFSLTGQVLQGPAEQNLRLFQTSTDEKNVFIQLS